MDEEYKKQDTRLSTGFIASGMAMSGRSIYSKDIVKQTNVMPQTEWVRRAEKRLGKEILVTDDGRVLLTAEDARKLAKVPYGALFWRLAMVLVPLYLIIYHVSIKLALTF